MREGWRHVGTVEHDLSLAVRLTDGVVGGRPVGDPTVRVDGVDEVPYENRSGYHLFFDLPATTVTVRVDGGHRYQDVSRSVPVDPSGSFDPGTAEEFVLEPTTRYSFPAGLTRVRGRVFDGGSPVPDATVSVTGFSRSIQTTDIGEYVYYFNEVSHTHVEFDQSSGNRYLKPGGSHPEFTVSWSSGSFNVPVKVRPGRRTKAKLTPP